MIFILTSAYNNQPLRLMANNIESYSPRFSTLGTEVRMSSGSIYEVMESVEHIDKLFEEGYIYVKSIKNKFNKELKEEG